jgi:fructose-bisphosphate aldolase class II
MLSANKEILGRAMAGKYAVGAFNIQNLETLQSVVTAAEQEKSPIIIGVSPSAIEYAGLAYLTNIVRTSAELVHVPMSLHLDHGRDVETVTRCLDAGFTSVMIDSSKLSFEENVALAARISKLAHKMDVPVEAELGTIGGAEDVSVQQKHAMFTDPQAAKEFVQRTAVDALAIAIGTSHGAYKFKGEPELDFERLRMIRENVNVPLVLHGASGIPVSTVEKATRYGARLAGAKGVPDEKIRQAIKLGITKINIATDLKLAFTAAVREVFTVSPAEFDPAIILRQAREAMTEVARSKMRLFGSSGKA